MKRPEGVTLKNYWEANSSTERITIIENAFTYIDNLEKKLNQFELTNKRVEYIIQDLKNAKSHREIKKIINQKESIAWSDVNEELKDMWYETLGDANKGLYF